MKLKRIKGIVYDRVYAVTDNSIELKRILPHNEYILWRVNATYDKRKKSYSYYILAKTRIDAKNKFLTSLPWLNIISNISVVEEDDCKNILGKPFKYVVF